MRIMYFISFRCVYTAYKHIHIYMEMCLTARDGTTCEHCTCNCEAFFLFLRSKFLYLCTYIMSRYRPFAYKGDKKKCIWCNSFSWVMWLCCNWLLPVRLIKFIQVAIIRISFLSFYPPFYRPLFAGTNNFFVFQLSPQKCVLCLASWLSYNLNYC